MLTHRSRGIDKIPAVLRTGSMLTIIMVSVRNGPGSLRALRWSIPRSKMLMRLVSGQTSDISKVAVATGATEVETAVASVPAAAPLTVAIGVERVWTGTRVGVGKTATFKPTGSKLFCV